MAFLATLMEMAFAAEAPEMTESMAEEVPMQAASTSALPFVNQDCLLDTYRTASNAPPLV